jgi:dolichyl-diphosphooligosaccharide--protein glycosyltransferase
MLPGSNRVILCLFILLVTYTLTMGLRLYEVPAWNNSGLSVAGEKLLATHDAYAWLAGAKDVGRKTGAALSDITAWVRAVTDIQYGNLAFWLPALLSPLAVIPIILLGRHWQLEEGALTAGALAAGCLGFFLRSRVGFFDHDILSLFFPLLFYALLIMVYAEYLRPGWLKNHHPGRRIGEGNRRRFLLQILGLGLVGAMYLWFYSQASPILLAGLGVVGVCVGILSSEWRHAGWLLLGLLIVLGLSLGGLISWTAVALALGLFWRKAYLFEVERYFYLLFFFLGLVILIDTNLIFLVGKEITGVLRYAKIFSVEVRDRGSLNLPEALQSIREAQSIDWSGIIHRMAGHWAIFAAGLLGFGYVLFTFPLALVFVPLLGMSLFSFALGNRFTMYGGAVIGIGLGFGLSLILLRLKIRKSLRVVVQLSLCLVVLLPTLDVATGLSPAPVLPKPYAQTFLELKGRAPRDARLWQWWDYGYAGQYYAERITFGDGGWAKNKAIYPLAKVHMTHSPRQARQMMQYITVSQEEEFVANSTKYKNMHELWKPYLADPVAGLEEMGPEGAQGFVRSLAEKEYEWPRDLPSQYLVLSWENLHLAYWISYFGTWDLVTGQADPGRIQQVRGEVSLDLDQGRMELEGGTLELSGLDVVDHEDPKHFNWDSDTGIYALLNRITQELYLMDDTIYRSMMVQMLIRDPAMFEDDFELIADEYPWNRAYRAKN